MATKTELEARVEELEDQLAECEEDYALLSEAFGDAPEVRKALLAIRELTSQPGIPGQAVAEVFRIAAAALG